MSVIPRLACMQNRRDEVPNQELARYLVAGKDVGGIKEVVENLENKDANIQADCIKVLYEVGYLDPSLIADYVEQILALLKHKNNRMVWGGMITLATIATLKADAISPRWKEIKKAMDSGSVITRDNGVRTLALVAAARAEYNQIIFPYLLEHLATCRPKDVPQHAEKTLVAVTTDNRDAFIAILQKRLESLKGGEVTRVNKVIRAAQKT